MLEDSGFELQRCQVLQRFFSKVLGFSSGRGSYRHGLRKFKVIKGSLMVLSGTRKANCVYTLDGQAVTGKTLKGRKQLGESQTGRKIKKGNFLVSCKSEVYTTMYEEWGRQTFGCCRVTAAEWVG